MEYRGTHPRCFGFSHVDRVIDAAKRHGILVRQTDVTPSYISQMFIQEEGISLKDYITRQKLRFAKQQLIYSDGSYEAIAYTFTFSSQSHFGQVFKN